VQLDDEVAAGIQRHCVPAGADRGRWPRRPSEHLSGRVVRVRHDAARVAGRRIALVEQARRGRAIDAEVRVVHGTPVPGIEFERT
jgi:hypothetical protein